MVLPRLASSTDIGVDIPPVCRVITGTAFIWDEVVFEMKRRDRTYGRLETSCSRVLLGVT